MRLFISDFTIKVGTDFNRYVRQLKKTQQYKQNSNAFMKNKQGTLGTVGTNLGEIIFRYLQIIKWE